MHLSSLDAAPFHRLAYALSPSSRSSRSELPFFRAFVEGLPIRSTRSSQHRTFKVS